MKRHRRTFAMILTAVIVLQPLITCTALPFANVVYAEEEEEVEKPSPGVRNSDDHHHRVTPGGHFPAPGSGYIPTFDHLPSRDGGGNNDGGNGSNVDRKDPTSDLDPSRPDRSSGDRYSDGNGNENGAESGKRSDGGGDSNSGDGKRSGTGNDDASDRSGSGGNGGNDGNGGDSSDQGKSDGNDSNKSKIDEIKENLTEGRNAVNLIDLINKLENGESLNTGDLLFLFSLIKVSDDEEAQKLYETFISQLSSARSVGSEIKDTLAIRYGERGAVTFKDWFKFNTYKDVFIDHTKDFLTDRAYRILFGEDKSALVQQSDSNKIKLITPLQWLGSQLMDGLKSIGSMIGKVGSAIVSGMDRGLNLLGNGFSGIATATQSLLSKGIEGLKGLQNSLVAALGNSQSFAKRHLFNGINGIVQAADRGLSTLNNLASKFAQIGQAIANSSLGNVVSNAWTKVKNVGATLWDSGKNLVSKVANSKVGQIVKAVVHSPLGKIGSTALSALSIWSGINDITGDGPWYKKVAGGLSVTSGVLGIAAVVAAGTAAAPLLVGGAFVAGIGALAFTYGPKLVNAWNNSKFGQAVNNAVKTGVKAVADGARKVGNAIANAASNVANSISNGIASLFGR